MTSRGPVRAQVLEQSPRAHFSRRFNRSHGRRERRAGPRLPRHETNSPVGHATSRIAGSPRGETRVTIWCRRYAKKTITIEIPDDLAYPAGASDEDVARDARLALAILWFDRGMISQGKGAEIAGLTRAEFIDELGRANVSAIQTSVEELRAEMEQVRDAGR